MLANFNTTLHRQLASHLLHLGLLPDLTCIKYRFNSPSSALPARNPVHLSPADIKTDQSGDKNRSAARHPRHRRVGSVSATSSGALRMRLFRRATLGGARGLQCARKNKFRCRGLSYVQLSRILALTPAHHAANGNLTRTCPAVCDGAERLCQDIGTHDGERKLTRRCRAA